MGLVSVSVTEKTESVSKRLLRMVSNGIFTALREAHFVFLFGQASCGIFSPGQSFLVLNDVRFLLAHQVGSRTVKS